MMCTLLSHLKRPLAGAILILMATTAAAQLQSAPIHIAADHGKVSQRAGKSVYTGHVVIRQAATTLRGDELTIYRDDSGEFRAILTGDPAHLKRAPEGQTPIRGHAHRVVYDSAKNIVTLTGDAFIERGGNTLRSDTIRHDLTTARTTAGRGEGERVRITLQPANDTSIVPNTKDSNTDSPQNADNRGH